MADLIERLKRMHKQLERDADMVLREPQYFGLWTRISDYRDLVGEVLKYFESTPTARWALGVDLPLHPQFGGHEVVQIKGGKLEVRFVPDPTFEAPAARKDSRVRS